MANYHFGSQPPQQPLKIYWPFCSKLWIHWGVYWHSETPSGICHEQANEALQLPIRNFDGTFYVQVHPFDPKYFAVKVHPTGALFFTPHHSQLTLLQHIIVQSPFLKRPVLFLSKVPKYWLEDDGTMQTQLNGCVHVVSTLCPTRLKLILEIWCTMDPGARHLTTLQPLSNPWALCIQHWRSSIQRSATWTMNLLPMSRRLNREFAPMSRRLNRECPCEARGHIASGPTSILPHLHWLWWSIETRSMT